MSQVGEIFGINVFNDVVMRERLPKEIYKSLKKTIEEGKVLQSNVAIIVANSMKDWAVEKGATHFTHWFHPMTGITAEKHNAFLSPTPEGRAIMEFSGKELSMGESDASSFPSGGLRVTFEARGYTAWDPTSYAFVKEGTLFIPTAFCSYSGEALDKKTPLLRSIEAINRQAIRVLRLFGNTKVRRVTPQIGVEQEYFIIEREDYTKRKDLMYTGRTLFGARPPKGQELDDHYYRNLKERISTYMQEVDVELWKLGISAKTKHNEVAPAQHELAPIFSSANSATDHNQLIMQVLKRVAARHGMACLLHDKPFAGVNGSGKHNNWSLATDSGTNLFEPGDSPQENAQFLLFLCAVIKAVDCYQDMLRVSVTTAANDQRLGGNEAPPVIMSMYIGEQLEEILNAIEEGEEAKSCGVREFEVGVVTLPHFPTDSTDRNRTSPFAFTGNKFEFRMAGSSLSISEPNIVLNAAVAEVLSQFADRLEQTEDFNKELHELIRETYRDHKRIVFNGNNYSQSWVDEASARGLLDLRTTADAVPRMLEEKNVRMFEQQKVFSRTELESRYEIFLENYVKSVEIEAFTMLSIVRKEIRPAVMKYSGEVCDTLAKKKAVQLGLNTKPEEKLAVSLADLGAALDERMIQLEEKLDQIRASKGMLDKAKECAQLALPAMGRLRETADALEVITAKEHWPFPTYGDMLFRI